MKAQLFLLPLFSAAFLSSCSDENTTLGSELMPQTDGIATTVGHYSIVTRSVPTGTLTAPTNRSYLGSIIDPETQARTTSSFLAQFHVEDNTTLPNIDRMIKDASGEVVADSCTIDINHDSYIGDSLNVMTLSVHELDPRKALSENEIYHTNIDPTNYLMGEGAQQKIVSYTALDQTKPEGLLKSSGFYRQVNVQLPQAYGTKILRHYYAHPEHFKNSYKFARNVCAGFYFKHEGGIGTMISSPITTLNVYYRQHTQGATGNDTIVNTVLRIGSTEEVIQTSRIDNDLPKELLSPTQRHTWIKTPAGIHTEAEIPVGEILAGEHYNDTINSAKFVLRTQAPSSSSPQQLPPPQLLLLLPKAQIKSFFIGSALPDHVNSYIASYQAGSYTFPNIAALIASLRDIRDKGAGIHPSDNAAQRLQKWVTWEAENPDWNKVALLAVEGDYNIIAVGKEKAKTLQRLRHEFNPCSVRLEGGEQHPIELSVVYSRFQQ